MKWNEKEEIDREYQSSIQQERPNVPVKLVEASRCFLIPTSIPCPTQDVVK